MYMKHVTSHEVIPLPRAWTVLIHVQGALVHMAVQKFELT